MNERRVPAVPAVSGRARLKRGGLGACIVGVGTVDEVTERQVSAKVRDYMAR